LTDNFRLSFLYSDEGRAIYEEGYRVGYELGKGDVQKVADESYDLGYERGKQAEKDNWRLALVDSGILDSHGVAEFLKEMEKNR